MTPKILNSLHVSPITGLWQMGDAPVKAGDYVVAVGASGSHSLGGRSFNYVSAKVYMVEPMKSNPSKLKLALKYLVKERRSETLASQDADTEGKKLRAEGHTVIEATGYGLPHITQD